MSPPSIVAPLELVLLRAGAYLIACPSDQVDRMVSTPESTPWCSLEQLLGLDDLEPVNSIARQYLKICRGQETVVISLPSPPSMVTLNTDCIHPLPELLRRHCRLPGLVALGTLNKPDSPDENHWLLILDFRQL